MTTTNKSTAHDKSPARTVAETRLWDALRAHPGHTARDLAGHAGIGESTATKALARWETDGRVARSGDGMIGGRRVPSTWTIAYESPEGGGRSRLRRGELRTMISAFLHSSDEHGHAHTPGEIARALGRSAGAVSNALDRLCEENIVRQTSSQPRRFTLADADARSEKGTQR